MDSFVFGIVLLAAAFHASWNALIKFRLDPFLAIVLIAAAAGIVSLIGTSYKIGAPGTTIGGVHRSTPAKPGGLRSWRVTTAGCPHPPGVPP